MLKQGEFSDVKCPNPKCGQSDCREYQTVAGSMVVTSLVCATCAAMIDPRTMEFRLPGVNLEERIP